MHTSEAPVSERVRIWREYNAHRSIHTGDGPLVAHRGQVVVVAICDTFEQAGQVVALLEQPSTVTAKDSTG